MPVVLTVDHPPKNAHFADTVWWTVVAYASDTDSLAPSDTIPDRLVIGRNMFEGDNHEIHAHSMTYTPQKLGNNIHHVWHYV